MSFDIHQKLKTLGLSLPAAPKAVASYVPFVIADDDMLYIAGQIPFLNGETMHTGKLGENLTAAQGAEAARACALNILAQVNAAVDGDWSKVKRCVKLTGFVNCTSDFTDQPKVINGASDLMVAVLGEAGKHARSAVGAPSLPLGVAVEIEAIFELD